MPPSSSSAWSPWPAPSPLPAPCGSGACSTSVQKRVRGPWSSQKWQSATMAFMASGGGREASWGHTGGEHVRRAGPLVQDPSVLGSHGTRMAPRPKRDRPLPNSSLSSALGPEGFGQTRATPDAGGVPKPLGLPSGSGAAPSPPPPRLHGARPQARDSPGPYHCPGRGGWQAVPLPRPRVGGAGRTTAQAAERVRRPFHRPGRGWGCGPYQRPEV